MTAPWVVRNRVVIGCATITTDTRALWKANNPATYDVLAGGGWIDDVPDLPGVPPWPEKAAGISVAAAKAVDECAQASFYRDEVLDFWRDQPGEKARLAVQAVGMLWSPFLSVAADDPGAAGPVRHSAAHRRAGVRPRPLRRSPSGAPSSHRAVSSALAALVLGLNTLAAMVFAGTVRYRAPWDFVLALLAAFALERAWALLRSRRAPAPLERRAVDRLDPVRAALLREPLDRALPSGRADRGGAGRVTGEPADRLGERVGVADGDKQPVRPSSTISGRPPTALAITGRPRSIASSATIPKPSPSEGTTTTSARSKTGARGTTPEERDDVVEPEPATVARSSSLERRRRRRSRA